DASLRIIHFRCGPIAQLVEQLTLNQRVAGSSPARLTIIFNDLRHVKKRIICMQWHYGGTTFLDKNTQWFRNLDLL
ncbi:MAG: hypothetical protein QOE96_2473, partial [Blastocatellia bacterium]|nr:hypothetical protein [Blastocatellia bacterium]